MRPYREYPLRPADEKNSRLSIKPKLDLATLARVIAGRSAECAGKHSEYGAA